VVQALADDLNISATLARLHGLSRELQRASSAAARDSIRASLLASGRLLGLLQQDPHQALAALQVPSGQVERSQTQLNEASIAELQKRRL
jgi:cysteinyl-tRNA synthetase